MFLLLLTCIFFGLSASQEFFFEQNNNYPVKVGVEISKHVESLASLYQQIDVYETKQCGNMMIIDGVIQQTQWDNSAYNEMITHVPLMSHPNPRTVLIIGGGDGGGLTEVLKHKQISEVVFCDIDADVVRLSQIYFQEFKAGFYDPRVKVVIGDGAEFIKNFNNYFDVIIVDASDPQGASSVLYSYQFYQDLYAALTDDGIVVAQAESPFFHTDLIQEWHIRNKELFTHAAYYYALVPTYPSGVIGFTYCAKKYHYLNALTHNRAVPDNLQYYTSEMHAASFVLPKFLKDKLS